MTKLEENNIKTQIKILDSISERKEDIISDILTKSKELFNLLSEQKQDDRKVIFSKETFNRIFDLVYVLKDTESWDDKLGYKSRGALKDIKQKEELFEILIKN